LPVASAPQRPTLHLHAFRHYVSPHIFAKHFSASHGKHESAMLAASGVAGLLWDRLGASYTFYAGAAFCAVAIAGLALRPHDAV